MFVMFCSTYWRTHARNCLFSTKIASHPRNAGIGAAKKKNENITRLITGTHLGFLRRVLVFCLGAGTMPQLRTACFGHRSLRCSHLLFHIRKVHIPRTSNDTAARRDRSQPSTVSVGSTRSYYGMAHVKIRMLGASPDEMKSEYKNKHT